MFVAIYEPLYIAIYATFLVSGEKLIGSFFFCILLWSSSPFLDAETMEMRLGLGMEMSWARGSLGEAKLYVICVSFVSTATCAFKIHDTNTAQNLTYIVYVTLCVPGSWPAPDFWMMCELWLSPHLTVSQTTVRVGFLVSALTPAARTLPLRRSGKQVFRQVRSLMLGRRLVWNFFGSIPGHQDRKGP